MENNIKPHFLSKNSWFQATFLFLAAFSTGLAFAYPTFVWGEHPQYLIGAHNLLSVETGYALFFSLLKLIFYAQQPTPDFLSNVFSVITSALCVTTLFFFVKKKTNNLAISLLFSVILWSIPVFRNSGLWGGPISLLWLLGLSFIAFTELHAFESNGEKIRLGLAAILTGALGVTHHPILLIPFLIGLWMIFRAVGDSKKSKFNLVLIAALIISVVSAITLWFAVRPMGQFVWKPNFTGTLNEYIQLKRSSLLPLNLVWLDFVKSQVWNQLTRLSTLWSPLALLALAGFANSFSAGRRRTGTWILILPAAALTFAVSSSPNPDLMTASIFLALIPLAIAGTAWLLGPHPSKIRMGAVCILLAGQSMALLYSDGDNLSRATKAAPRILQQALLESVEPNGLFIQTGEDDPLAGIAYLQIIEGVRKDVKTIKPKLMPLPPYRAWALKNLSSVAGVKDAVEVYQKRLDQISLADLSTLGAGADSFEGRQQIYERANLMTLYQIIDENQVDRPVFFDRIETMLNATSVGELTYAASPPLFKLKGQGVYKIERDGQETIFRINEIPFIPPKPGEEMLNIMSEDEIAQKVYSAFYLDAGQYFYNAASQGTADLVWLDHALAYFNAGLEAQPTSGKLMFLIGSIQHDLSDHERSTQSFKNAEAALTKKIDKGEREPISLFMLAEIYQRRGDEQRHQAMMKKLGLDKRNVIKPGVLNLKR